MGPRRQAPARCTCRDGSALVDSIAPIEAVFGQPGRAVADVIAAGRDADPHGDPDANPRADLRARSVRIEELLQRYLPIADDTWPDFIDVIATILGDRSLVSQVASVSGWSARTLQRWFDHYLGLSPAWVLARYRLQDAAGVLAGAGSVDLAELAARLGYYDQAHFTRAFTSAVGMPPGAYARWCRDRLAEPVTMLAGWVSTMAGTPDTATDTPHPTPPPRTGVGRPSTGRTTDGRAETPDAFIRRPPAVPPMELRRIRIATRERYRRS